METPECSLGTKTGRLGGCLGSIEGRMPSPWGFPRWVVCLWAENLLSMFLEMTWGTSLMRVPPLTDIISEGF